MKKKTHILLLLIFVSTSIIAQEKIGNKIYLYGNLENSVSGSTLVSYGIEDPKGEVKTIDKFREYGVDVISWNKLFMPGYNYSDSEINDTIDENNIQTIILIKLTNSSSYVQSNTYSFYNSWANSAFSYGSSETIVGNVGLSIEIYTRNNNFNKPLAVIRGNANNSWGEAGTQRGVILKIINRTLRAMKKNGAFG